MLPARNYKKCIIKPLPLDLIIKTKSPTVQVSMISSDENSKNGNHSRQSITSEVDEPPLDSSLDYTIDESDDEDKLAYSSSTQINQRKSLKSPLYQRSSTSTPSNLKDLLRPSPLEFVKKRKRKLPDNSSIPVVPLTPTKAFDGIDESSPIKKIKGMPYNDESCIFINRHKKSQTSKRSEKPCNSSYLTLADQMKDLMEREKTNRTIWRHSVTSHLKNKFKEMVKGKDTINLKLSNFRFKFHCGFADGLIIESTNEINLKANESVQLIFPSSVCLSMGFTNGVIVRLVSPWNVISINNQRFIINPFWISVIKREHNQDDPDLTSKCDNKTTTIITQEVTIVDWICPCQQSLGAIDPLDCNQALSQRLSQIK